MIRAVIFDYGGVVTSGGVSNGLAIRMAENMNLSIEVLSASMKAPWVQLVTGKIDEIEFWSQVESSLGTIISDEHRNIWNTWKEMSPRTVIIDFIHELIREGYVVGLLSNVVPSTEAIIRENKGYELFKPCILSCKFGYAKPDTEIYDELINQLGDVKPEEIVFIDDQERCLIPAREIGIKTVLAEEELQIIHDIKQFLKT